eukprot:8353778-Alexandrium_andersonii.AAC.1
MNPTPPSAKATAACALVGRRCLSSLPCSSRSPPQVEWVLHRNRNRECAEEAHRCSYPQQPRARKAPTELRLSCSCARGGAAH